MTAQTFSRRKRWLGLLNLAAVVFLGLYILVIGNIIVFRHPYRVDLTEERLHTLSEETRNRLELVENDILVIIPFLFHENAHIERQVFARCRSFLNQYVAHQPKIRIEAELNLQSQEDSLRWVEIRDRYSLTQSQLNSFIFVSSGGEDLWQVVPIDDLASWETNPPKIHRIDPEGAFTAAITRLIRKERRKIYVSRDWGEASIKETGQNGASRLREELGANGYEVEELSLATRAAVPPDCDLLLMMSPSKPFDDSGRAKIHDYLLDGGRLLVMLGPGSEGLDTLLDEWGIRVARGQAFQKQRFMGGVTRWSDVVVALKWNPLHPITRGFSATRFEVLGQHVRPLELQYRDNLTAEMLIETVSPPSESLASVFIDRNANARIDEGEETHVVVWGAAVHRRRPDRPPPGYVHLPTRVVVFGDASPFTNFWIDRFSHRDLALNSVRWLLGQEREIGTSGDEWVERRIKWSPDIAAFLFWVPIFLFPGIVLCFGTFIYFIRRS